MHTIKEKERQGIERESFVAAPDRITREDGQRYEAAVRAFLDERGIETVAEIEQAHNRLYEPYREELAAVKEELL